MKKFVGKSPSKQVEFMDGELTIRKLSTGAVRRIGNASKGANMEDDASALDVLTVVLQEGVVLGKGDDPITTELLEEFPLDDLNKLSNKIMEYAGLLVDRVEKDGEENEGNVG